MGIPGCASTGLALGAQRSCLSVWGHLNSVWGWAGLGGQPWEKLSSPRNARASLRPFLSASHLSWAQEGAQGPAQRPKAGAAVSWVRSQGSRTRAGVSPFVPQLWLSGQVLGEALPFPPAAPPQLAWLLPLGWECCWACGSAARGSGRNCWWSFFCWSQSSEDVSRCSLWDQQRESSLVCCRALAWLALEPGTTAGWGCTAQSQPALIQWEKFNYLMVSPFKDGDAWWLFGSSLAPVCSSAEFGRGQCWISSIVHVRKRLIPQDKFPNAGENISSSSSQLAEDGGKRALL